MRRTLVISLIVGAAIALVGACGGGGAGRADVQPGPVPEGASFHGVWFSPQYGEMHLVQTGTAIVGEYFKDERRGRIQGTAQGNLLRFEWTEERELVAGRPTVTRGRGYWQLDRGEDGKDYIRGEWGLDDSELGGGQWNAYKLRNRRPEVQGESQGGESDGMEPFEDDGGGDAFEDDDGGSDDLGDDLGDDDLGDLDL